MEENELLDQEHVCASQRSHFEHKEQFLGFVDTITRAESNEKEASEALSQLSTILDSYQEQSHLLDPSLEAMIQPVMTRLRRDIDSNSNDLNENTIILFRFLYLLTKTRGFKTIVKFMSHEVTDLEPVYEFLNKIESENTKLWEARYICFIWLSLICMIPFDLKKIDSDQSHQSLIVNMLDLCKKYLRSTGKERDGASLLIARLLSRQDLCDEHMLPFIEWAKQRLSMDADVFETTGILQSLCITYQLAPRKVLLPTLDVSIIPLLTLPFFDQYANNALVRKLKTKLTQRVGLCYLKPKVAAWRYQRGNRSLRQNLEESQTDGGLVSAKPTLFAKDGALQDEDGDDDISDNLEVVIEILLSGLGDKDTIVRWSAAKGIGRITQRLPQELAEDVVGSIIELFQENTFLNKSNKLDLSAVSDQTWHGASLAVAELARRGLLLPDRLKETMPWILRGLKFDLKRGSHSIGAHVRDACCYVCWAFARAYAPEIIQPFVTEIAQNLVVVSVFDREINVRRASSAAFQENVGRQGIFPHGIDIIQKADYFSLGNKNNAFLSISYDIAKFEEYRYHLIEHLISVTAKHWDKSMRVLASKSLYTLVPLDPHYFIERALTYLIPNAISTDMQISHGALLAIAEICLALVETKNAEIIALYHKHTASVLAPIVSNLPPKSLTTFGSEHVREAACHLITHLSKTHLVIDPTHLQDWKKLVHTSLERKEESVQGFAVLSFGALAQTYGLDNAEIEQALKNVDTQHANYYSRRGYGLALGTIDYRQHVDWVHQVVTQLCKSSQVQENPVANDAESKRNAVIGLHDILNSLGDDVKSAVSHDDFQHIMASIEACLTDYSTDQRGDVGSWVRIPSMELLNDVLPRMSKLDAQSNDQRYLEMTSTTSLIAALLKQSVERIDKVRSIAGKVLCELILKSEHLRYPGQDYFKTHIHPNLQWSSPSDLYPVMVHVLKIPEYRLELLTGLISSAGGLTESLVRHSSSCLIEYMDSLPTTEPADPSLEAIFTALLDIAVKYEKQDRVTIPLLDVLGLLYESGTLTKIRNNSLYIGLISIDDSPVKVKAIQQMLSYLVHAFPRIRIEASDQLFTQFSVSEEADEDMDMIEAIEIITGTDCMGKLKRKKLANALDRMLKKNEKRRVQQVKADAYNNNIEKAKKNQVKPKKSDIVERVRVRPQYNSKDKILLIGEGNFSFARSLCENYLDEGAENLTATCYDSEQVLYEKYGEEAKDNIALVREFGGTVLFEVDGTDLPKDIKKNRYTKIVFNFPHAGLGIKDQDRNIVANQKLLNGFFDAAEPLLTTAAKDEIPANKSESRQAEESVVPDGEIHVTLKTCTPYNLWGVKSLVKAKGVLAVRGTAPFFTDDFPGYEHRRTLGFKEGLSKGANAEIVSSDPKRYIFVRKEVMDAENEKAIKGAQKRKLEILKIQMGKKVKRKKVQHSNSDDED
ncbi:tubulin-specific chaperone D-like [Mucor ambiguus]|uniref:Tubulin-specific chaperone D-like n=1 Tax=Mucor ambiguus TaxID=91626 RepID=A0A0C9N8J3_9FUNG|nr:tubulin-specific chaperone D-like [Mucor ambiguus]